jgi:hypothetical protein
VNLHVANQPGEEDLLDDVTLEGAQRREAQQELGKPVLVLYRNEVTVYIILLERVQRREAQQQLGKPVLVLYSRKVTVYILCSKKTGAAWAQQQIGKSDIVLYTVERPRCTFY